MLSKFANVFSIPDIRNKILFILAILVVFRLAANIPLPNVDPSALGNSAAFGILNLFSGGGFSAISIVLLGLGPYITASIIMQLLTMIVPSVERMYKEEGEAGRQKFNTITRVFTVPLAVIQTFAMIALLRSQGVVGDVSPFTIVVLVTVATAGTIFLMWLGELITEKKLGNGVSMMIFAGIVAGLPSLVSQLWSTFNPQDVLTYIGYIALTIATIVGVVFISEGQRIIPISYARRTRSGGGGSGGSARTHLPIKVNQAGVIPIIFAVSLVTFPTLIGGLMQGSSNERVVEIGNTVAALFANSFFYGALYFGLVVLFTYFYTAVIFDPEKIAKNLQKQGGYIDGVRPGQETVDYLGRIVSRITLAGAIFLGLIAILPLMAGILTGNESLAIGGTSILIVVSVVIELVKQMDAQLVMHNYEKIG